MNLITQAGSGVVWAAVKGSAQQRPLRALSTSREVGLFRVGSDYREP